jgi:hypothetical protein
LRTVSAAKRAVLLGFWIEWEAMYIKKEAICHYRF